MIRHTPCTVWRRMYLGRSVSGCAVVIALLAASTADAGKKRRTVRRAIVGATATAAMAVPAAPALAMPEPDGPRASSSSVTTSTPALDKRVRAEQPIVRGADPSVLTIESGPDAGHYIVTTGNLTVRHSTDLVHWRVVGKLFKGGRLPRGVVEDFWAPSLSSDGKRFFLRYSARGTDGILRVRSAVSKKVTGPYRDLGPTVPHRAGSSVGDIDAAELRDIDGSRWLLWKHDGNSAGQETQLYIQRLGRRGEHLVGKRYLLATNDRAWEGISIEAPSAFRRGKYIYISYAGSMYHTPDYNVGMLRIRAPGGLRAALASGARIVKHRGPVADSTSARHVGMAHGDFVLGGSHFVSHGWRRGQVQKAPRETIVRVVKWQRHWPKIVNSRRR